MSAIVGVHPHAECYPLLSDDELHALAADIAENGLRDPLTKTPDGWLIDGRNRYKACEIAGVEPIFVVYEGADIGAFVRSRNLRRHQPVGSLAMSTALSMLADGLRGEGRWKRDSTANQESLNSDWKNKITQCGTVLDYLPDLAQQVVSGDLTLDAAYREACDARDAERLALEEQERLVAEEADARTFIEANAPDLAALVGSTFETFAEAHAVWEKRNREEAARIAEEKAAQAAKKKADRENAEDRVRQVLGALFRLDGMEDPAWRDYTRASIKKYPEAAPPAQRGAHGPRQLRDLAKWIAIYADELEN